MADPLNGQSEHDHCVVCGLRVEGLARLLPGGNTCSELCLSVRDNEPFDYAATH